MKKKFFNLQFLGVLSLSLFSSISAFAGSLVIEVPDDPEPTKETIVYQCNTGNTETKKERAEATYYNAGEIALVDLKWNGKRIIASNVIAASGAKYVGAQYIWWTKKDEATFYDLINDPKEEMPLNCVEEKGTE
ncbi:MliC family protein [Bartonella refiksaydamii]|uniref:MliC family protein n=1 Tax=Bartonella refiksaydamii TaxID=2654951 RepID=UPI0012EC6804|nr:MliC family protein [Bartonella refiksaydamii]